MIGASRIASTTGPMCSHSTEYGHIYIAICFRFTQIYFANIYFAHIVARSQFYWSIQFVRSQNLFPRNRNIFPRRPRIILFLFRQTSSAGGDRQSVARRLYPQKAGKHVPIHLTCGRRVQSNAKVCQKIRSKTRAFLVRYYKSVLLLYPSSHSPRRASIRDSPQQFAILFGLPFDADYQTRSSGALPREFLYLDVDANTQRLCNSVASPPARIYPRAGGPTVYPLAVPRKKRGNHFGILSGITNATREGQKGWVRGVASEKEGDGRVEDSSIAAD